MFYCLYDVLYLKCGVSFMSDVSAQTPSKMFGLCLVSPQIFPKVFEEKMRRALMFFLLSNGFCLGTLPCRPFLVESWPLTSTEANEAWSSLDIVVWSFVTSWISRRCYLGVISVGRPFPGWQNSITHLFLNSFGSHHDVWHLLIFWSSLNDFLTENRYGK